MNDDYLTRKPVHMIKANEELLKSQESKESNYRVMHDAMPVYGPVVRQPMGRKEGAGMFRRYPDGALDYEGARDAVFKLVCMLKEGVVPLDTYQRGALAAIFPSMAGLLSDPAMAAPMRATTFRITEMEAAKVAQLVMESMVDHMEYVDNIKGGGV